MGLNSTVGAFNTGTGAVGTTVAVTGLGYTPKVVFFWWSGRTETTDTAGRANHGRGFGSAVSATDRRCVYTHSDDASASAFAKNAMRSDACIAVLVTGAASGLLDGLLDLQSMDSDGFTLVVDDQFATSFRIHYLALGGSDLTNVEGGVFTNSTSAAPVSQSVTTSFKPDCLVFFSTSNPNNDGTIVADSSMCIGAVGSGTISGNVSQQGVWAGGSNDAAATMQTISYCIASECIAVIGAPVTGLTARATFTSFDVTPGFTINWLETTALVRSTFYIALQGAKSYVSAFITKTDTTTDITESGFGFSPKSTLFVSHGKASSTTDNAQDNDEWSCGAFSDISTRGTQGTMDVDAGADSIVATAVEHDEVYINIDTAGAVEGLMDIKSVDVDGFTCIMDNADPSAAFVWYLAFGSSKTYPGYYSNIGWF